MVDFLAGALVLARFCNCSLARLRFLLPLEEGLGRASLVAGTLSLLAFGYLTHVLVERTLEHMMADYKASSCADLIKLTPTTRIRWCSAHI